MPPAERIATAPMATRMSERNARRIPKRPQSGCQQLKVAAIEELAPHIRRYTLMPAAEQGLVPFEAGCSLPVHLDYAGKTIEHEYAISSSPKDARNNIYQIVVKLNAGGYASSYILDTWAEGDLITVGMPTKDDAFNRLDDGEELIAIAGSVGVVPFHSIAKAIAEGDTAHRLVLFYVADTPNDVLYRDEWQRLEGQSGGRLTVVPVVSAGDVDGYERWPVTREMIARYADISNATFLIRGPASLVAPMRMELSALNLSRRRLRSAFSGDSENRPTGFGTATHRLVIRMGGESHALPAREDETILYALEKAGLQPPADCRTGICGFCHTTLISGEYYLATDEAGERKMHDRSSLFHPCCSYPASDMEIVMRPVKA